MENFHDFSCSPAFARLREGCTKERSFGFFKRRRSFGKDRRGPHGPQVADKVVEAFIAKGDTVNVDYRHVETRRRKELCEG